MQLSRCARFWLLAVGWVVWLTPEAIAESGDAGIEFFEKSIRPVLVKHCYECHSAKADEGGKLQAGLALDTKQGLLRGGESGPVIVPGNPEKSLLIEALRYESYEMPPSGKLPAEVIDSFAKWIAMGAPDPRDDAAAPAPRRAAFAITAEDRRHWSFQPVRDTAPPQVANEPWVRDDLDRYVLARLEKEGRQPSDPADKYALLRRTTYALTGLPPKPEEIAAFVADDGPDAFEKVVDRLLASPEFGVHWGRRWLDGVRYASDVDKSGEYRRWVIHAFNDDVPYDQFVKMQIAGDLLPATGVDPSRVSANGASLDGITATGMLALAVWEQVGRDLAVAEIVDSQIDVVGRQVLGLTLACARCHDHKFDPISTEDYYAMAGIFFSSHIATGKLIADNRLGNELVEVSLLNAEEEAKNRAIDAAIDDLETRISSIEKKIPQAARLAHLKVQLQDLSSQIEKAAAANKQALIDQTGKLKEEQAKLVADQKKQGWDENPVELAEIAELRLQIAELGKSRIKAPAAVAVTEGGVPGSNREKIGDAPVYLRGEFQREGAIVPRRFPIILAGEQQTPIGERTKQSGRRELADWIASADNPLTARVMVNRIWQQMIGRGLVRSPDNFGRLGDRPTHPELLDHLAVRFVASGWSVKQLVREIALSATFQQSSFAAPRENEAVDADNIAIGKMNRRRLTYEEFRDTLLLLGEQLALEPASASSTERGKKEKRTIYEPLERRKVNITAAMFDGADPKSIVANRAETTTAPQALFLMNNPLVVQTAERLARRLAADSTLATDQQRLQLLWLTVLSRPPSDEEAELALNFIDSYSWERFIQALLGTNEFAYID